MRVLGGWDGLAWVFYCLQVGLLVGLSFASSGASWAGSGRCIQLVWSRCGIPLSLNLNPIIDKLFKMTISIFAG